MKKLLFTLMCLTALSLGAQTVVSFKLTPNGSFISEEGKDFIIVPFEGKNAHQIFQQLSVNANALYKNPSKVMSVVDDASITIRGYDSKLTYTKFLMEKQWISGYYNLNFQIKDGRVKVAAPIIDEVELNETTNSRFSWEVEKWFKNGEPQKKAVERIELVENNMNTLINAILNSSNSKAEEDW